MSLDILIADDHDLVRETIAAFLQSADGNTVTAVSTLSDALKAIDNDGPYDIVLLDFDMPGMNGLSGLKKALDQNDGRPVGIISGTASKAVAEEAIENGAAGFLPKTISAKSMMNAVSFMAAGEVFAPVSFMSQADDEPTHKLDGILSDREKQVLVGLTKGQSNKEIARDLDLQEVTVKLHVKTLSRKLSARNRTHAAMIARDEGFV